MTLSDQCALLLSAITVDLLQVDDIVDWADRVIVELEKPPVWIIDLSTLNLPHLVDYVSRLAPHASTDLPLRQRVQVIVFAHRAGLLTLRETMRKLFKVTILDRGGQRLDTDGELLADALVEWDCQDDLTIIDQPLRAKVRAIFESHLSDAQDVRAILPERFANALSAKNDD